jgi:hypothetical protein
LNNRFGQGFEITKACSRKIWCAEKSSNSLLLLGGDKMIVPKQVIFSRNGNSF